MNIFYLKIIIIKNFKGYVLTFTKVAVLDKFVEESHFNLPFYDKLR